MWRKGNPCALLVGLWIGVSVMENGVEVPQKIENRTTLWSSNSTSRYISEGNEISIPKRYLPHVLCSISDDSQDTATTWISTDTWIKRMWYVCVCVYIYIYLYTPSSYAHIMHTVEYYSAIKMKEILPSVKTLVSLEGTMLSEISQTEGDKHCMISLICGKWAWCCPEVQVAGRTRKEHWVWGHCFHLGKVISLLLDFLNYQAKEGDRMATY